MWLDNIKYRDNLNLNKNITFGVEIEFDKARKRYVSEALNEAYNNKNINNKWKVVYEETIHSFKGKTHIYGGEAVSDILKDNKYTWYNLKYTCDKIKQLDGVINKNCGSHVHLGANILEDNIKYYDRLMKIWVIYEDIILRFCYGETDKPRNNFNQYAGSPYLLFKIIYDNFYHNNKLNLSYDKLIKGLNYSIACKNLSLSFRGLDEEFLINKYKNSNDWYNYKTLEFRAGNGTLNPVIWQNYINLYTKLLLCCINDNKDWDKIDKLFIEKYNCEQLDDFNYEKAIDFSNFIFDNDIDKDNFNLEYIKDKKISLNKLKIKSRVYR